MDILSTQMGYEIASLAQRVLKRSLGETHAVKCKRIDVESTINELSDKMTFHASIDVDSEWVTLVFKTK